ncbi:MAG: nucleotide exchange factor GrpE, partial [Candidatus Pacebacteria bacterium]|nr:nucleotide exchange factor GrpE [Candidatus Paceibacterota bacterium]
SDWAKGMVCIKSQFDNFLKEAGVEEIKAIGEKFDPNLFESVGEEESGEEEGTVIVEIQKGYNMAGKVIRPAKVKIAKGKEIKTEN